MDEGEGGECSAYSPVSDPESVTDPDGARADLVIYVAVRNGEVLVEQSLVVPFVGQVGGMIP